MRPKITMEIGQATYDELLTLSETIGYPPEAALSYAVRLVNACIREGLLTDVPARAWPQEAHMDQGKVIEFPGAKKTEYHRAFPRRLLGGKEWMSWIVFLCCW